MSNQDRIAEYWDELIATDSEDTFRYLVEIPDRESVVKFTFSKYKEAGSNDVKTSALEVLKEVRGSASEKAIQEIALTAQSLEEWKNAVEARIYSNQATAIDFLQKEKIRFDLEGNKKMIIECENLICDLT